MRPLAPIVKPTLAAIAVGAVLLLIAPYALLVMAPAVALAWLVAIGAFTGEQAIAWVRRATCARRAIRPRLQTLQLRPSHRETPRGGLLIAAALASRPPPATA